MRRLVTALGAIIAVCTLAPATPARAAQCATPVITGFDPPPLPRPAGAGTHFRESMAGRVVVHTRGASSVDLAWGDGEIERVGVQQDRAQASHVYASPGLVQIVAVGRAACGATSRPGGLTVPVRPACTRTHGADVYEPECLRDAGRLEVSAKRLTVTGAWLTPPCYDVLEPAPTFAPEPVARASACAGPAEPYPIRGRLPVRPGRRISLDLRAPAARITVALATAGGTHARRHAARRRDANGRRWRIRLPRTFGRYDRLVVRAYRGTGGRMLDEWAVGLG